MKKLQQNNLNCYFSGDTLPRASFSFIFMSFIVLNNFLYQTNYQINQLIVSLILFILIFCIICSYGRVSKALVLLIFCIAIAYIFSIYFSESSEGVNRSIAYFLVSSFFAFVIFYGHKVSFSRSIFYIFILVYLIIAGFILLLADRTFINPNWVALTLFYLFFLVSGKASILFLVFGLALSFFVFESRGTSVVFLVAILLFFSQKMIGERFTKIVYFLVYFVLVFALFYIIHLLSSEVEYFDQIIYSISERGLGGRDTALIQGYRDLVNSNLLGVGPASRGGYENPVTGKGVHIHFGLLELMLKYSALAFFGFVYLMIKLIKKSSKEEFPMIGGSMMTVFFYNGLAPSHLGLNILLLIVISKVLMSPEKT